MKSGTTPSWLKSFAARKKPKLEEPAVAPGVDKRIFSAKSKRTLRKIKNSVRWSLFCRQSKTGTGCGAGVPLPW
jgi:hypothetical protein